MHPGRSTLDGSARTAELVHHLRLDLAARAFPVRQRGAYRLLAVGTMLVTPAAQIVDADARLARDDELARLSFLAVVRGDEPRVDAGREGGRVAPPVGLRVHDDAPVALVPVRVLRVAGEPDDAARGVAERAGPAHAREQPLRLVLVEVPDGKRDEVAAHRQRGERGERPADRRLLVRVRGPGQERPDRVEDHERDAAARYAQSLYRVVKAPNVIGERERALAVLVLDVDAVHAVEVRSVSDEARLDDRPPVILGTDDEHVGRRVQFPVESAAGDLRGQPRARERRLAEARLPGEDGERAQRDPVTPQPPHPLRLDPARGREEEPTAALRLRVLGRRRAVGAQPVGVRGAGAVAPRAPLPPVVHDGVADGHGRPSSAGGWQTPHVRGPPEARRQSPSRCAGYAHGARSTGYR